MRDGSGVHEERHAGIAVREAVHHFADIEDRSYSGQNNCDGQHRKPKLIGAGGDNQRDDDGRWTRAMPVSRPPTGRRNCDIHLEFGSG